MNIGLALNDLATDFCLSKVQEKIFGSEYGDYFYSFYWMYRLSQSPTLTGVEETDQVNWVDHVNKMVDELEQYYSLPVDKLFSETFISNYEIQTNNDGGFMKSKQGILDMLYKTRNFSGLAEGFLKHPIAAMQHHSVTLTDRFHSLLPEYLADVGVRFVGNVGSQPAMSLAGLRVRGFIYYNKSDLGKPDLGDNPFEKVVGGRKVFDENGNVVIEYNYYGPGNPMDDEYIKSHPPINTLDAIGFEHDESYSLHGYNTDGARRADKLLVEQIQAALDSGVITKDSPYEEYKRAKAGLTYFSFVSVR